MSRALSARQQIAADEALARSLQQRYERELTGRADVTTPLMNQPGTSRRGGYLAAPAPNMTLQPFLPAMPEAEERPNPPRNGARGVNNNATGGNSPVQQNQRVRLNVIQNGIREVNNRRLVVFMTLLVNVPQMVAAALVLTLHWNDDTVCDADHRDRWKWWAVVSSVRMLVYTVLLVSLYFLLMHRPRDSREVILLSNARNGVDALGLIWFVVGNMWLFGQTESCAGASASPVYQLCVAMLLITYLHICLPCIIAMLMIPVLCFCLPCVIRILSRLHDPMRGKGANQEAIDRLPIVKFQPDLSDIEEPTCPICLTDFENGNELRCLPCKHSFHKNCVDEWLLMNATCPNCRTTILDEEMQAAQAADETRIEMRALQIGDESA